ncbi:uncharacterized protein CELE_Y18H1A.7 [Caenorhabditis elegans]|uniref:Uncharacterized protein n=2 Tax=Caenorhabditis elegans TaxID=6239 RepID=Q9BL91_CAEEL|nr:Uncharacterized protein CELE_Y18H1A.7 [Caenorhabditis elegans]CCD73408.1 Uncharacterized protein CELE_Y18H1A.7 [Caenorhabditis elegans]|eukprot:NP_490773.3 Uncharacterized protein CELE_Y18H1A.7 [Caenorhabditis elegans]
MPGNDDIVMLSDEIVADLRRFIASRPVIQFDRRPGYVPTPWRNCWKEIIEIWSDDDSEDDDGDVITGSQEAQLKRLNNEEAGSSSCRKSPETAKSTPKVRKPVEIPKISSEKLPETANSTENQDAPATEQTILNNRAAGSSPSPKSPRFAEKPSEIAKSTPKIRKLVKISKICSEKLPKTANSTENQDAPATEQTMLNNRAAGSSPSRKSPGFAEKPSEFAKSTPKIRKLVEISKICSEKLPETANSTEKIALDFKKLVEISKIALKAEIPEPERKRLRKSPRLAGSTKIPLIRPEKQSETAKSTPKNFKESKSLNAQCKLEMQLARFKALRLSKPSKNHRSSRQCAAISEKKSKIMMNSWAEDSIFEK